MPHADLHVSAHPTRRTTATWTRVALATAACVTPLAWAADGTQSCPAGQMAATRIDYEGNYNLDPTVDMFNLRAVIPNVGYTRRTVFVADGYYKQLGTRRNKPKKVSAAEEGLIVGGLQAALGPAAANTQVLGKATHAGIPCEVRQFLVPGNSACIAKVRGQYVTLAEEMQSPAGGQRSWMQAKTKADVCVSAKEFEAPAQVRFKQGS